MYEGIEGFKASGRASAGGARTPIGGRQRLQATWRGAQLAGPPSVLPCCEQSTAFACLGTPVKCCSQSLGKTAGRVVRHQGQLGRQPSRHDLHVSGLQVDQVLRPGIVYKGRPLAQSEPSQRSQFVYGDL